jgi:hypothetical protein
MNSLNCVNYRVIISTNDLDLSPRTALSFSNSFFEFKLSKAYSLLAESDDNTTTNNNNNNNNMQEITNYKKIRLNV